MASEGGAIICQVSIKKILYSQAIALQLKAKQEKEKEERRLKNQKKRKEAEDAVSAAGVELPKRSARTQAQRSKDESSSDEELNLVELPSFHHLTDLDEDETFTSKRQRFETNEHFRIFDGYYQFINDDFALMDNILFEARFKGTIPFEYGEYVYIVKVVRCTDTKGNFFRIDKILAMGRNELSMDIVTSIFDRALNQTKDTTIRVLNECRINLNAGQTIEYKDFCNNFDRDWIKALQEKSPFFANYDKFHLETLIHCFPNDFIYLIDLEHNNMREFNRLWEAFITNIRSFFFQPICREYGLSAPMHMMGYMTWFLQNSVLQINKAKPLDMSGFLQPHEAGNIIAAINLYKKIKAALKADGSTAFFGPSMAARVIAKSNPNPNPNEAMDIDSKETATLEENEAFKLLLESGVIQKQNYDRMIVYAPRSDAKATKIIMDSLVAMCKRFKPLPMVEDFVWDPKYNDDQLATFAQTRYQPIIVCTAPPGHGKTTVIEGMLSLLTLYLKKKGKHGWCS